MTETPQPPRARNGHQLPEDTTPFVGRSVELERVLKLFTQSGVRLLTLVGPGGIGKSRLALAAARQLASDRPVFWVDLVGLGSAELLLSTIATVIAAPPCPEGTLAAELPVHFGSQPVLLVLDHFEHLLAGASIVTELLAATPGLKVLTTSREPLALQAETQVVVAGLSYPPEVRTSDAAGYEGVQLFLDCARRFGGGAEPPDALAAAARVVQLVQGMPLAIVLAASWARLLSYGEIALEVQKDLDFLRTDLADVPERQRSIRAVCERSWSLLGPADQRAFARLCLFPATFTRSAAESVAEATLDTLLSLAGKALLTRESATGRYQIHALLRQYGAAKLHEDPDEEAQATWRFCEYHADFLQLRVSALEGVERHAALAEIDAEIDNLRLAWHWMHESGRTAQLGRALDALILYYDQRARVREAQATLEQLEASPANESLTYQQAKLMHLVLRAREPRALADAAEPVATTQRPAPLAAAQPAAAPIASAPAFMSAQPAALRAPRRLLSLHRENELWVLCSPDGVVIRLKHSKGLVALEQLVNQPGRPIHVLQLEGVDHTTGDAGAILDPRAKLEYRRRLEDLRDALAEAESFGDTARAAQARGEIEAITEQLAKAVGLGGRDRHAASEVERARVNVQRRLKDVFDRVSATAPEFGRHLAATIKTGTYCVYEPL